jgi:hypothetical protein
MTTVVGGVRIESWRGWWEGCLRGLELVRFGEHAEVLSWAF